MIRAFFKSTNRRTIDIENHGVGNFKNQTEFVKFCKEMYTALIENPELLIEFRIKNFNYQEEIK